ncbi:MAG: Xaa-Pro peptidase family protein [Thermomicrobiales bacterium]
MTTAPTAELQRLETFRASLAAHGLDRAIVSWAPHVRYLSGLAIDWAPVFVVVDRDAAIIVVPEGTEGDDRAGFDVATYRGGPEHSPTVSRLAALTSLASLLDGDGVDTWRTGIERDHLSVADLDVVPGLAAAVDIGSILIRQRQRKDAAEIARIRFNLGVVEAGFDAARELIRPGATELAVWAGMHAAMMRRAGGPFVQDGRIASGPRTLDVEPVATNRVLASGDMVYIDLFPVIEGYSADLTRAFVVGEPTPAQHARHAVLEAALAAGVATLKPGIRAGDVDAVVRATVATALDGYVYPHHTGHGYGLQGQEAPLLIPADETILAPGMVIAIEPGVYLPDTGGMRLEGNYLITATGCESLSDYPMKLFACG